MKGQFLVGSNESSGEGNVYADKSALILVWLLTVGLDKEEGFSLREVAKANGVSVGLVQKTFGILVLKGVLSTQGIRTAKRFFFKSPRLLFESWIKAYHIVRKCKMWTYRSGLQGREELIEILEKSTLAQKTALALHSAAAAHKYQNTNLNTLELYMLDPLVKPDLEKILQLEPQERGYEVLLVEPYYKALLNLGASRDGRLKICPIFLTCLDLYHFPLRGLEQAEFMIERVPALQRIYRRGLR